MHGAYMMREKNILAGVFLICLSASAALSFAQERQASSPDIAGEFFGMPVMRDNYNFAKRVVMTFSASWRGAAQTEQELDDLVWQELLLSFEAYRRGITVESWEVDKEIDTIVTGAKADFNWRVDKEAFAQWARQTLGVPLDIFRNQVEHLLKLQKLRQQVIDGINPDVSDDEALQKFLDEYNTLLVELRQFDDKAAAEQFYADVSKPGIAAEDLVWDDLMVSRAAAKRGITVDDASVEKALIFLVRDYEAPVLDSQGKIDPAKIGPWISSTFGLDEPAFREHFRKVVRIDALRQKIFRKEEPALTAEEKFELFRQANKKTSVAYRLFIDTYEVGGAGILRFESLPQAQEFYRRIKREATAWDQARRLEPDLFKRPGFVALDFLLHMWGFDRQAAYDMMKKDVGTIYPPAAIYKGYGVFKVLKQRPADPAEFNGRKNDYVEKVKQIKKYEGFLTWLKTLKEQAKIRVYKP